MSLLTAPERNTFQPVSAARAAPQSVPPVAAPAIAPSSAAPLVVAPPAVSPHSGVGFYTAPARPFSEKINLRLVLMGALVLIFFGVPFAIWVRAAMNGGITNHGNYSDVDLKAMSTFELDQVNGQPSDVPARFRALEGKRVALEGEMWSPNSAGDGGLKSFQLVYSKTKCCFSGPPLAQHFVDATLLPGHTAEYYNDGMVRVWGTMHIRFRKDPGGVIKSVYAVDVDKVEPM